MKETRRKKRDHTKHTRKETLTKTSRVQIPHFQLYLLNFQPKKKKNIYIYIYTVGGQSYFGKI